MFLAIGCTSDADILQNIISVTEKPQVETLQPEKKPEEKPEEVAVDTVETIPNETEYNKLPIITIRNTEELIRELVSDRNLYLLPGNYKLPSTVFLTDIHDLNVSGAEGAFITGDLKSLIRFRGDANNINFKNIFFNSSSTSKEEDGGGIVYFDNTSAENILFDSCTFTCPELNANGLKFVSEGSARSKNITITNCKFLNIGRMAVETQNHNNDGIVRLHTIRVVESVFNKLGLQSPYGMAISLSGPGNNGTISDNTIVDAKDRGIETVGWSDLRITNNTFSAPNMAYNPIAVQKVLGGENYMKNISITGNKGTVYGGAPHLIELSNCDGLIYKNNNFYADALHINDVQNSTFTNNFHSSDGGIGLYVENKSTKNLFANNTIVSTSDNATTIAFYSSATENTLEKNEVIKKGKGGSSYQDMNGGNNNLDQ